MSALHLLADNVPTAWRQAGGPLPFMQATNIQFRTTFSRGYALLRQTWWRLHAGGGGIKVWAGDNLPNSHKIVSGHTPPLA